MAEAETDISILTESQQLALQQFTSVTDQDVGAAIPLLRKCEWNVQIAIARFFDGEPADPIAETASPSDVPPPHFSRRHETLLNDFSDALRPPRGSSQLDPAPRIVPQPDSQVNQPPSAFVSLVLAPVNLLWSWFSRTFSFISWLFPFLPRLLVRFSMQTSVSSTQRNAGGRRPLGTRDTASRFIREFEEEYGSHQLPFVEHGYAQAFDTAKRDLKFLLVVPLSPEHDDTFDFVRNTLLSPEVVAFINDPSNRILLWAGTVQDSEAYQVATALNFTKFPAAALIVHTASVSATAMSVIVRIAGPTTPQQLLERFRTGIAQHSEALERVRATQTEQQASRNLREQQNSAYERSLAQDRERARQRREAEAAKEKAEREVRAKADADARFAQDLQQWKKWRAQSIPAEPGPNDKDVVRISLRLPSGERVTRKFTSEAHIEEIYAFVECYDILSSAPATSEKDVQEPEGFSHDYKFQLVSPMPREVYNIEAGGSVRERIGRSGNLIVEKLEDDEEEG